MLDQTVLRLTRAPPLFKQGEVKLYLFGFPIDLNDLDEWAIRHPDCDLLKRIVIAGRLPIPVNRRRCAGIQSEGIVGVSCLMVGSNCTPEDLARAQDLDLVEALRTAIDMPHRPPEWFRAASD